MIRIGLWILFGLAPSLFAFPEMIRHQYASCRACHISPNGGGILTEYGRALSGDVLSTWSSEGEAQFLYGLVRPPEWLSFGGDFRVVQTKFETSTFSQKKFIFMQTDLEAAVTFKGFTLVGTIGIEDLLDEASFGDRLIGRRHYLQYQATDNFIVRFGRFLRAFGTNNADHIIATKRGLGFDDNTETYNLELSWIDEGFDVFVTGLFGRFDDEEFDQNLDKGIALRGAVHLEGRHRLGLSYLYGSQETFNRHLFGPFFELGFTPRFFLLAEIDFQIRQPDVGEDTFGVAGYLRLDYEIFQGFHIYGTQEWLQQDLSERATRSLTYALGVQWFPRPHFEWQASFQKIFFPERNESSDLIWLMFHYYL